MENSKSGGHYGADETHRAQCGKPWTADNGKETKKKTKEPDLLSPGNHRPGYDVLTVQQLYPDLYSFKKAADLRADGRHYRDHGGRQGL